jgi:hypothetical protein
MKLLTTVLVLLITTQYLIGQERNKSADAPFQPDNPEKINALSSKIGSLAINDFKKTRLSEKLIHQSLFNIPGSNPSLSANKVNQKYGLGIENAEDSFSGKVYIVSLGFDDYSKTPYNGKLMGLNFPYCKSDAKNFIARVRKDSLVKKLKDTLFDSRVSKRDILQRIDEISKEALPNDAFIFFCASMGQSGFIVLPNGESLSSAELYEKSQNLFCRKQLFFLDICYGDLFITLFRSKLKKAPEQSKMNSLDRVVLGVDISYESVAEGGGMFTMSYVKNKDIHLFDIFSGIERKKISLLNELYKKDSSGRLKIKHFSEKVYYSTQEEDMKMAAYLDSLSPQKNNPNSKRGAEVSTSPNPADKNSIMSIEKGETLCFIVGCQDFDNYQTLGNTLNDTRKVRNILDSNYKTKIIYLENPSYEEFYAKLNSIKQIDFKEGSQFLFYAASHGIKDECNVGQLVLKNSYSKDAATYNYFALPNLKRFVAGLKATNTMMLIDICHSGTMFEEGACSSPTPLEIPKDNAIFTEGFTPSSPAYKNFLNQKTNLFFGSSVDQEAADAVDAAKRSENNSPFATTVIDFLKNNKLEVIDSYYLQKEITNNVMKLGSISLPMFCSFASPKNDGRFLFIKKNE